MRLLEAAGPPPFTARMNKRIEPVHTFEQLRPVILDLAKEGLNLQRFKGLGEMNPEQLWDTTMNPENRVLQQVSVEDAAAADEMFSMLMGDRVSRAANLLNGMPATSNSSTYEGCKPSPRIVAAVGPCEALCFPCSSRGSVFGFIGRGGPSSMQSLENSANGLRHA